jgi:hypothetical protein
MRRLLDLVVLLRIGDWLRERLPRFLIGSHVRFVQVDHLKLAAKPQQRYSHSLVGADRRDPTCDTGSWQLMRLNP